MYEQLADLCAAVEAFTARFDARLLSSADASLLLPRATALKNMASHLESLVAARVADGGQWKAAGARSPEDYLAQQTGTTVSAVGAALRMASQVQELPAVGEAARRGALSPAQVAAVTSAASVAPGEQDRLLADAVRLSLKELQSECGATRAAHTDAQAMRKRIHAGRGLSTWTDAEGRGHLKAQGPAETIASIAARVNAERDRIFTAARKEGRAEPTEAYSFDALEAICLGDAAAASVKYKGIIRVDLDTLLRGHPIDGETCDVAGIPVAVSAVEELLSLQSTFLTAVITKGEAVAGVLHHGRAPTAKQQTALEWLHATCAVEGCSQSARLQRDHREDWAKTKVTSLDLLDLLCAFHHGLKTTKGWGLVEGRGKRPFVAPDDVRHPQHAPPAA